MDLIVLFCGDCATSADQRLRDVPATMHPEPQSKDRRRTAPDSVTRFAEVPFRLTPRIALLRQTNGTCRIGGERVCAAATHAATKSDADGEGSVGGRGRNNVDCVRNQAREIVLRSRQGRKRIPQACRRSALPIVGKHHDGTALRSRIRQTLERRCVGKPQARCRGRTDRREYRRCALRANAGKDRCFS